MARITEWRKLPIALTELCLATTLRCGQSFRWRQCEDLEENTTTWACTLRGRIVQLSQDQSSPSSSPPSHIRYRSIWPPANKSLDSKIETPPTPPASLPPSTPSANPDCPADDESDDTHALLTSYLNLQPDLSALYSSWSHADSNFRRKAPKFTGIRILNQDSWEALICFICSSNNNIARISQMVEKLCLHYGPLVGQWEGKIYHDFPDPEALTGDTIETELRELGFGYRAKYIAVTARMVVENGGKEWLDTLRNPECPAFGSGKESGSAGEMRPEGREGYRIAHEKLLELQGVGPKVADCVCLFGLGWGEAVPVDTHVWQIAQRDYKFGKGKHASLTKATYDAVANHFRKLWGQEAGWAHSVLFTADLRAFSERLTTTKVEVKVKDEEDESDTKIKEIKMKVVTAIKRERDEETEISKPILQLDESTVTSSERVKRRRRSQR